LDHRPDRNNLPPNEGKTSPEQQKPASLESQALFEQFFESSPDGVLVVNSEGLITQINKQTEKMFGYGREELQGQPIETLIPDQFRSAHEKERSNYLREPHMRAMGAGLELFAKRKDGTEFPVEIMLSPIESS